MYNIFTNYSTDRFAEWINHSQWNFQFPSKLEFRQMIDGEKHDWIMTGRKEREKIHFFSHKSNYHLIDIRTKARMTADLVDLAGWNVLRLVKSGRRLKVDLRGRWQKKPPSSPATKLQRQQTTQAIISTPFVWLWNCGQLCWQIIKFSPPSLPLLLWIYFRQEFQFCPELHFILQKKGRLLPPTEHEIQIVLMSIKW